MASNENTNVDSSSVQRQVTLKIARMENKRLNQLKSTNIVLDPSSTCHRSLVIHPGLPPQAIDLHGNPSLESLMLVARMARQVAMQTPCEDGHCFLEMDRLKADYLTFMASAQYNIHSCAYQPDESKFPLYVVLEVGHVGRTSFSYVTTITLPSREVMLTAVNQAILIDPATRRPTMLPDHWRVHYGPLCVRQEPLIISKSTPPDSTVVTAEDGLYRLIVRWSDTDHNNHTNYASYVRFALDALYSQLRKGHLGGDLTEEDVKSGVAEVKVAYQGESGEGDVLDILVWCPAVEKKTVICCMSKEGRQPVCQAALTFHPS